MQKCLIAFFLVLALLPCSIAGSEQYIYTREELTDYFIENGALQKDESFVAPVMIHIGERIYIDDVIRRFPEFQSIDMEQILDMDDPEAQLFLNQTIILYELQDGYAAVFIYDMVTREITVPLLLSPACDFSTFSGITKETALNEITGFDPNAYNNPLKSSETATYHYISNGNYYKVNYKYDRNNDCFIADHVSSIDYESCPPIFKIIGAILSR